MKYHVSAHEYWFEVAQRLEKKAPHGPIPMLSLSSQGPVWKFACTLPGCGEEFSTLSGGSTPTCYGGLPWSFSTNGQ